MTITFFLRFSIVLQHINKFNYAKRNSHIIPKCKTSAKLKIHRQRQCRKMECNECAISVADKKATEMKH